MGTCVRNAFVFSLLFINGALGSDAVLSITLRINDQTDVPRAALNEAKHEVRRIFNEAGMEALWLDCPAAQPVDPACEQTHGERDLVIRIIGGFNIPRTGHDFGSSLIVREGFSRYATVFYGAIRGAGDGEAAFEGRLLGYTIAHEVGHLLLGSGSHSPAGIMTTRWDSKVIRRAPTKSFSFTKKEAERLRAKVRDRVAAERAAQGISESDAVKMVK